MLPKYLPPEDSKRFQEAWKAASEMEGVSDAFRYVHSLIDEFETNENLEPLEALKKAHALLCSPK